MSAEPAPAEPASAKSRMAAAENLNRLSHAILANQSDETLVAKIASAAADFADALESNPARNRLADFDAAPQFMAELLANADISIIGDGEQVDVFRDSPVTGSFNPFNVGMVVRREGDEAVGTVVLKRGWEGAPDRSHGGVVASLVDEAMGCLLPILGTMAFTGGLNLSYKAPCPIGVPIEFRASLDHREGRKLYLNCTGSGPGGVFVESTAIFIAVAT